MVITLCTAIMAVSWVMKSRRVAPGSGAPLEVVTFLATLFRQKYCVRLRAGRRDFTKHATA